MYTRREIVLIAKKIFYASCKKSKARTLCTPGRLPVFVGGLRFLLAYTYTVPVSIKNFINNVV
jgi:hypothetical protein